MQKQTKNVNQLKLPVQNVVLKLVGICFLTHKPIKMSLAFRFSSPIKKPIGNFVVHKLGAYSKSI